MESPNLLVALRGGLAGGTAQRHLKRRRWKAPRRPCGAGWLGGAPQGRPKKEAGC